MLGAPRPKKQQFNFFDAPAGHCKGASSQQRRKPARSVRLDNVALEVQKDQNEQQEQGRPGLLNGKTFRWQLYFDEAKLETEEACSLLAGALDQGAELLADWDELRVTLAKVPAAQEESTWAAIRLDIHDPLGGTVRFRSEMKALLQGKDHVRTTKPAASSSLYRKEAESKVTALFREIADQLKAW